MVVIRLARFGSINRPKYRVLVADHHKPSTGKYLELVGSYNPKPRGQDPGLVLDLAKIESWIKKGAQPTPRVKSLMKKAQAAQK